MSKKDKKQGGIERHDLYNLQAEVKELRALVLHLLHCHANNAEVDLSLPAIRNALFLPSTGDNEQVLDRLNRTQASVIGKTPCPSCQSMVVLRENVNPRCSFCGHEFEAEKA